MTKDERNAYGRGYAAGKKCQQNEILKLQRRLIDAGDDTRTLRQRVFTQILSDLMSSNTWTIGNKKVNDAESYIELANRFTEKAMRKIIS